MGVLFFLRNGIAHYFALINLDVSGLFFQCIADTNCEHIKGGANISFYVCVVSVPSILENLKILELEWNFISTKKNTCIYKHFH